MRARRTPNARMATKVHKNMRVKLVEERCACSYRTPISLCRKRSSVHHQPGAACSHHGAGCVRHGTGKGMNKHHYEEETTGRAGGESHVDNATAVVHAPTPVFIHDVPLYAVRERGITVVPSIPKNNVYAAMFRNAREYARVQKRGTVCAAPRGKYANAQQVLNMFTNNRQDDAQRKHRERKEVAK